MSKPCSQLNSKVIRDKVECHIIADIENTCSVVAFKCVWRVSDDEIERAWNWICEKRDECDLIVSKLTEVCFFFSAISTSKLDSKKKKSRAANEDRESDESNDESAINPSQISSPGKQTFPAISYWLACQTPNGSAVNPMKIQRALGKCGLEFYLSRASRKKNSHALNQLCQVLKDHKNPCLMNFVEASYQHCLRALQEEIEVSDDEQSEVMSATENVVRVRVLHDDFKPMMTASIQELRRAGLKIDCFGLDDNVHRTMDVTLPCTPHKPLSCPVTVLVNDIHSAIKKLQFSVYRGDIYKKVAESRFTFRFLCPMKTFLLNLMGNECFKDRLVQHFQRVLPLLSEPESSLIGQLKLDRDLVEVQDGWLWSFSSGSFVREVIPESQLGLTSPRAYIDYSSLAEPDAKYFRQILENSLSDEQTKQFCADFLALFRQKEHKRPVPCAIGASDSGKTSLFSPVFQIVPLSRIARVTKQKSFNKSMIDSSTEVIFLDEAYTNLLDIDDWKIICQGGFTSHDVKWKKAQGFFCRASMYITCQQEMDFGEAHNDAMDKRLHKYYFKSLPDVDPDANQWLREHAMDCIVWAQRKAANVFSNTLTGNVSEEDGLQGEDVQRILSVSLVDENLASFSQCSVEGDSQNTAISLESANDSTDSSCENDLEKLRCELEKAKPDGLRHRQISMLLKNAERHQEATTKALRNHRLAGRRRCLVDLGVVSESQADILITDPDSTLPLTLEQRKQEAREYRAERLLAQQRRDEQEKVESVFTNPWLIEMEKETAECNWRLEKTEDVEMRSVLTSLLEINCEKLRAFHEGQGTLRLQVAVEQRRKLCLERGWVEPTCVNCVRDVYSPLPMIIGGSNGGEVMPAPTTSADGSDEEDDTVVDPPKTPSYKPPSPEPCLMCTPPVTPRQQAVTFDDEDDDEHQLFVTPKTPSYVPRQESHEDSTTQVRKSSKGKKRKSRSRGGNPGKKSSNTILNYFPSSQD